MKQILGLVFSALLFGLVGCSDDEIPLTVSLKSDKTTYNTDESIKLTVSASGGDNLTYYWKDGGDVGDLENGWVEGSESKTYSKSSAGSYEFHVMVQSATASKTKTVKVTVKSSGGNTNPGEWPLHEGIKASLFWVGEGASDDNGDISNFGSAWRSAWCVDYGLEDKPTLARDNDGFPTDSRYKNIENPFYFALPYNDLGALVSDGDGNEEYDYSLTNTGTDEGYKKNRKTAVYWAGDSSSMSGNSSKSMVKNRWVKISANGKECYAQWEDAGPFYYNDISYVFGTADPANKNRLGAGIDLSPAVMKYLFGSASKGEATVSWEFVNTPEDGPWTRVVTKSQCAW